MNGSRRNFLALASAFPAALFGARIAAAQEAACYDPAALPLNVKNRRAALGFVEQSADSKRRCGLCTFFQAKEGNCGTCQLLVGAPVTAGGVCNSFAAKAG